MEKDKKTNIMFLVSSFGRGGQERAALRTASLLQDAYHPIFVPMTAREEEYTSTFEVLHVATSSKKDLHPRFRFRVF